MSFLSRFCKFGLVAMLSYFVSVEVESATCPFGAFDGGSANATNDAVVISRHSRRVVNAPLVANTRYANSLVITPAQIASAIDTAFCAYDVNGDNRFDAIDSTIIARYLLGFKDQAITSDLALGSGARPSSGAILDFLASGCMVTTPCLPKTYYVAPDGNDATGLGTNASPWKTFAKAFSVMNSGEMLIVKDGVYAESLGDARQPPSGTPGRPTTILAETDGGAVIDAQGSNVPLVLTNSHIRIEGLKFVNGASSVAMLNGNKLSILRSAFGNAGPSAFDGVLEVNGADVLVEDSWMWGRGKAGVVVTGARATLRRLVIRMDYYAGDLGFQGVLLTGDYDTQIGAEDTIIENVIAIDFGATTSMFDWKGGFRSRDLTNARTHRYFGTIALNLPYDGYRLSDSHYENVLAWNVGGRGGLYEDSYKSGYAIKNATVGVSTAAGILTNLTSVTSSIVYKATGNNSPGAYNVYHQTPLPNGATNTLIGDPLLKHIVRIEPASPASGSGPNGSNRGATIVNRYQNGVLTNLPLWPWPNEARIKADFQTNFGLPGVNPRRGFAADGTRLNGAPLTLSSYIWEYLGTPCPVAMCN